MNKLLKYQILLIFSLLTTIVVAQNYTLSYRVLESEDGLLNSRVNSFLYDSNGFMWISTEEGIARYDGHQFQWFSEVNSKLRGVPKSKLLVEDDEGYIWVTYVDKIDLIHTKTLEIIPLEEKIKGKLPFNGEIFRIRPANNHRIFINQRGKWYLYHSSTGIVELPELEKVFNIEQGIGDKLWIYKSTTEIIGSYDLNSRKITPLSIVVSKPIELIANYTDKALFWTRTLHNINIFELKNGIFNKIAEFTTNTRMTPGMLFIYYIPEQDILVTNFDWENKGLSVIDLDNKKLLPIDNSTDKIIHGGKREKTINVQGVLWKNFNKKIIQLNIKKTNFHHYVPRYQHRGIGIFDNHLFVGKYKASLDYPNQIEQREETFFGVVPNIKDELWVGMPNGIGQIDIKTNTIAHRIPSKFKRARFWSVLRSQEGQWWASSIGRGLFTSNFPQNDSLYQFDQYNEFEELRNIFVDYLFEEGDYIWACSSIGLYLIHKKKGVVKKYHSKAPMPFQIPASHIHFLYKDASNTYWLTTRSQGLIRFQINKDFEITESKRYTVEDGLSSNMLYCIVEDDHEQLWISTLNGISCFDKKTEDIQVFSKDDGIRQPEFNRISYAKSDNGRIFFGSLQWITAFYPEEVLKNTEYDVPVIITKFLSFRKKNNEPIDQTLSIQATKKIVIQPTDRFFRMNVSMFDFYHSNKLRYAYKIEGLFNDYQPIDGNTIEIGGLPYGRYTLRVRGQGADRRFSKQELILPLIIVRPFYLKWWFILIALAIVSISIYQVYQWRIRQLEERKRELELLVQERTAQIQKDKAIIEKDKAIIERDKQTIEEQAMQLRELDEVKSKFFANISHELRTPLTLLLAPMESIIKSNELSNKNFTYLQMMCQNGNKLLKRINELLDLSRLDANRLEVNEQPIFLYPFFKTILSTFESAANLKDIKLLFKYQLDENTQVNLDDDKVEKIISNYLSNALKFTPKQGEIELHVSRNEDKLLVSVKDTGIGILPNDLIKIFDRFYQTKKDNQQQGTGIGLSLCRELAKVLNGKVWVTSQINEGSTFYLELPLVETFAQKEVLQEEVIVSAPILVSETTTSTTQKFRPNILIAEDNSDLRQLLTMILQEDYNVTAVENGEEALAALRVASYGLPVDKQNVKSKLLITDNRKQASGNSQLATLNCQLIISDIMMPIMDGIELLTKVKTTKELQHIPMIMLTARQSIDVKIEALRIGVDDYLTKPFKEEELKARVANLIKNSQNRNTLDQTETTPKVLPHTVSPQDLEWLKELETIITDSLGKSTFKLTDTASEMNISYRRLQQKLKIITGLTPKQYQRIIMLTRARQILKSGKVQTVKEVVYQLGLDNHHHFSKLYKQEFGIMPSEELK